MTSSWHRFAPIDGVVVVLAQRARLAHNNNNINEMARMTNPNKTIANMQETTITTMCLGVCVCVPVFCLCAYYVLLTAWPHCVQYKRICMRVCVVCEYVCSTLCATVAFALLDFHFSGIFNALYRILHFLYNLYKLLRLMLLFIL